MKKVQFVITNLVGGGAERVLLDTIKKMNETGKYDVNVLSIFNYGTYVEDIKKIAKYDYMFNVPKNRALHRILVYLILRMFKYLGLQRTFEKKIDRNADIFVAYLEGVPTKLVGNLYLRANQKKFAWVHIDPIDMPYSTKYFKSLSEETLAYKEFDEIVCVSNSVLDSLRKKHNIKNKGIFIENVYDYESIVGKSKKTPEYKFSPDYTNIITIGRLMPQKGYRRLVEEFAKIDQNYPHNNLRLHIVGEGPERKGIESIISKNDLQEKVILHGFQSNPYNLLVQANFFIASSYTEGYSTVVVESIVLGVPVVATDCAGMRDILGDSLYGDIVENSSSGIYKALERIVKDSDYREKMLLKVIKRKEFYFSDIGFKKLNNILNIEREPK